MNLRGKFLNIELISGTYHLQHDSQITNMILQSQAWFLNYKHESWITSMILDYKHNSQITWFSINKYQEIPWETSSPLLQLQVNKSNTWS